MKIEGRNSVSELIKTEQRIDKILIEDGIKDPEARKLITSIKAEGIKAQFVPRQLLDKQSETGKHQGFIAITADYNYFELEDLIEDTSDKDGFIVILDEILDPHNLGSIIRVCECAGVDGLVISKDRSAQVTDSVMRISEGGANHVKVARVTNINNALEKLKDNGYWVTGAELGGDNLYKADLTGKLALVVGGEDSGIKKLTKSKCDRLVTIPMRGKVNSLNASVACGVVVFEALRQRTKNEKL